MLLLNSAGLARQIDFNLEQNKAQIGEHQVWRVLQKKGTVPIASRYYARRATIGKRFGHASFFSENRPHGEFSVPNLSSNRTPHFHTRLLD